MARYGTVKRQMDRLQNTALQQPEEIRQRRTAAEGVLSSLEADIGKAGTYDLPGAPGSGPVAPAPAGDPTDPSSAPTGLLSREGYSFKGKADVKKYDRLIKQGYSPDEAAQQAGGRAGVSEDSIFRENRTYVGHGGKEGTAGLTFTTSLDPEKAKAQIESSSAFRQVSRMMAESEQLLARSGPLYDEMIRSTQLPILEGSAVLARENTEAIRKALARGGAARRDGFAAIAKIRAQESSNIQRGQALAKAHMELDQWARKNATDVINFASSWARNQAGIRESYHSAMDSASQLMATASLPFAFQSAVKAQEYRDAASAQNRGKVMRQITGVLGVVGSVVSMVYGGGIGAGSMLNTANESVSGNYARGADGSRGAGALPTQADPGVGTSGNYFGGGGQE